MSLLLQPFTATGDTHLLLLQVSRSFAGVIMALNDQVLFCFRPFFGQSGRPTSGKICSEGPNLVASFTFGLLAGS